MSSQPTPPLGRHGGAEVRSAARSRAERARGLRAISSASGRTARRPSRRKLGGGAAAGGGHMARHRRPRRCAARRNDFDPSVLERVKRNHRETAARHQQPLGGGQSAVQFAQFIVDRDAQRLKGAGRRVEPRFAASGSRRARSRPARRCGESARCCARRDDGARDPAGKALLAERADQLGQLGFGRAARRDRPRSRPPRPCACRAARRARNEKPRSAASSCSDETPRSRATPAIGPGAPRRRAAPCRRTGPRSAAAARDARRQARRRAAARRDRGRSRRRGIAPPRAAPRCSRRRQTCRRRRPRRRAAPAPRQPASSSTGTWLGSRGQQRCPECPSGSRRGSRGRFALMPRPRAAPASRPASGRMPGRAAARRQGRALPARAFADRGAMLLVSRRIP